jgi:hypothetical protein
MLVWIGSFISSSSLRRRGKRLIYEAGIILESPSGEMGILDNNRTMVKRSQFPSKGYRKEARS